MKKFFFILLFSTYPLLLSANQPKDWQLGFQEAASESMRDIINFHNNLLVPIIIAIKLVLK